MIDFKNKLLVKYSLEFIVIVVGISFTFWIDEWNRNRLEDIQHIKDINSIIDDLDYDSLTIDRVNSALEVGDEKTKKIIQLIELKQNNKITYEEYYESIIDLGFLYSYETFFMTDATYKSLISNGRINMFPQEIHSLMNKYYEAIAKRIYDNNQIVDNISLQYYNYYHPFSMLYANENLNNSVVSDRRFGVTGSGQFSQESIKRFNLFFKNDKIKKLYLSIDFYSNTINLRNRINIYAQRIREVTEERNKISKSIRKYLIELQN